MLSLPFIPSVPHYTFKTVISEVPYDFEVHWNPRDASWYFSVFNESGVALRQGVRVVLGVYLGRAGTDDLFNNGVFIARDSTKQGKEAGFDDIGIGQRVEVLYLTALEVQGILDGELTA